MNPLDAPLAEARFGPGSASGLTAQIPPDARPRTALPVLKGHPIRLAAHGQRLAAGAAALGFPSTWLSAALEEVASWVAEYTGMDLALRLSLDAEGSCATARLEPLPRATAPWRLLPLPHPMGDLRACPLAPHKGLTGPWGASIRAEAMAGGGADALLLWPDGTVAETGLATVALERDGRLVLPPAAGRVASLTERLELPAWARARGLDLQRSPFTPGASGQLWCLNALRGIWPVTVL